MPKTNFRSLFAKLFGKAALGLAITLAPLSAWGADTDTYTHREDVIYGRKFGTALTMDVFTPKENANGAAVVWVVSGGWHSDHNNIQPNAPFCPVRELTKRGYTVFAVVHGSQPRYTIPEVLQDMHRSVRYIRSHAAEFKIDENRIGITGASAGGHISLMQGTAGNEGDPKSPDPINRVSSRVQAVACFFPPTDFLNYGKPGEDAIGRGILKDYAAPFAITEPNERRVFVPITDETKIVAMGKAVSPINHATADDPPSLIIHGDKDLLVPIQQAEIMVAKLKEVGVPAELVVKPGAVHGWPDVARDQAKIGDWFDKYLAKKP